MTAVSGGAAATVKVGQAKGRPMLSWVGKRPLREVRTYLPADSTAVAVRITDMLGEEVIEVLPASHDA